MLNFKKKQFLKIKREIQLRDKGDEWFYTELDSIRSSIMENHGVYYSSRVEDKNIERLQQLVWWLEDERKQRERY